MNTPAPVHRCGFAALIGRPNVGKSTLLNALIGKKISIVTPKPQTTRHRVLGLVNLPDAQIAFVDTPGLHLGERRALNRAMNRTAAAALADADLVVFVVEALRFGEEDEAVLRRIVDSGRDAIAVVNKVDHEAHPTLARVLEKGLARYGIELLGVLPYQPLLSNPTLSMLQEQMRGELLHPGPDLDLVIEHVAIGAMQAEHVLERVGPGSLLIVPGDREDVIRTMVSARASTSSDGTPGSVRVSA